MGHRNRSSQGIPRHGSPSSTSVRHKKKKSSTWTKAMLGIVLLVVVITSLNWVASLQQHPTSQETQQPTQLQPSYPSTIAGDFYNNPTVTGGGTEISIPYNFVKDNKMVFVDVALLTQTDGLEYQGRYIPLSQYDVKERSLPLIVFSTPSGKIIAGIRVCEPCSSFSFHIYNAKYLTCDACGTQWDVETLEGVAGGCTNYPPPQLPVSVADNIVIDLSTLKIKALS